MSQSSANPRTEVPKVPVMVSMVPLPSGLQVPGEIQPIRFDVLLYHLADQHVIFRTMGRAGEIQPGLGLCRLGSSTTGRQSMLLAERDAFRLCVWVRNANTFLGLI